MKRVREALDTTIIGTNKNRFVLRYDANLNRFVLSNIKEKLIRAAQDDDLADRFIEVIEPHINVETTEDYGTF